MQASFEISPIDMLTRLYRLRWCAVGVELLVLALAAFGFGLKLAFAPLLAAAGLLVLWNLLVRQRLAQPWPVTEVEVFSHLTLDTLTLSFILFWGGGPASPFVSLYLLPIAIAAAVLPALYAWIITALAAGAYTALLFGFSAEGHIQQGGFAMHVMGMWLTFIIGALLLMAFVAGMAQTVRRRDRALTQTRERMLRNEQITALGTLAAGAAHELGTPLSTMAITVSELREQYADDAELQAELSLLDRQIGLCKQQISALLGQAGQSSGEKISTRRLRDWLTEVVERWRLMRPEIQARVHFAQPFQDAELQPNQGLAQSLINLLNNAADASLDNGQARLGLTATCDGNYLELIIDDHGTGLRQADRARAGRVRFSTKAEGSGLGLVLSHASLEQIGGEVSLQGRAGGGTRTRIWLPMQRLHPSG